MNYEMKSDKTNVLKTGPVIEPVNAMVHGLLVQPWLDRGWTGVN